MDGAPAVNKFGVFNAQYTPPTRLNYRVESRRRRVGVGGVY